GTSGLPATTAPAHETNRGCPRPVATTDAAHPTTPPRHPSNRPAFCVAWGRVRDRRQPSRRIAARDRYTTGLPARASSRPTLVYVAARADQRPALCEPVHRPPRRPC